MLSIIRGNTQTLINIFFGVLLLFVTYLLLRIIKSKKIKVLPTINKKGRLVAFLIRHKVSILIIFSVLTILVLGTGGTVLAISLKTKTNGDVEYKNADYEQALTFYLKAKDLWFPEKVSIRFRDRDLYSKIAKTRIMVQSADNYLKGKMAFDKGDYTNAKSYLSNVVVNDPNKQQAIDMLSEISKTLAKKAEAQQTPKPSAIRPSPTNTQSKSQPESYSYDSYYPIILSLSDDKGNINKLSDFNGYNGPFIFHAPNNSLKIGDTIRWKVEASDPKGRQILYNFVSITGWHNNVYDTKNELTHTVNEDDLKSGQLLRIFVTIKSSKEFLRYSSEYDDGIYMDYKLLPE